MDIKLGDKVKDIVTGYIGIATSKVEYLNGCVQFGVEAPCQKDGKTQNNFSDVGQLKKVSDGLNTTKSKKKSYTGGPQGHRTPSGSYKGK